MPAPVAATLHVQRDIACAEGEDQDRATSKPLGDMGAEHVRTHCQERRAAVPAIPAGCLIDLLRSAYRAPGLTGSNTVSVPAQP